MNEKSSEFCPDNLSELIERGADPDKLLQHMNNGESLEDLTAYENTSDIYSNRDEVFPLLYTQIKKIDGERKTVVACTAENFLNVLRHDNHFRSVRFNTLRGVPEKITKSGTKLWTDPDDAEARTYIEASYGISSRPKYDDAFQQFQHEREYDPVQDRISRVKWDGVPRVEKVLIEWLKCDDTPYNRECSRLLFAGGINRAFVPGSKFDDVIVLVGNQGGGKSTFCQWLALLPELYSSVKTINGQKGLEAIQGKWICEIEELLATLANDQSGTKSEENAKAFLSTASDFYRKPYDRRPTDNPRHCIFVGTTNRNEFLTDKTGNRRWYPVQVKADGHWLHEHAAECKADILQAWAEMKAAFDQGKALARPTANVDLLDTIRAQQSEAEQDDYRVGLIEEYVSDRECVCLIEIWQNAIYAGKAPYYPEMRRGDANEVSTILVNKLGWSRGTVKRFGVYGSQKSYLSPKKSDDIYDIL